MVQADSGARVKACDHPSTEQGLIAFRRAWIRHVIDCMSDPLPSGRIGDVVFLLRGQFQDALDRPDSSSLVNIDALSKLLANVDEALAQAINRFEAIEEYRKGERLAVPSVSGSLEFARSARAAISAGQLIANQEN